MYLLTYSQAELQSFSTRQSFAEACTSAFEKEGYRLLHYACCIEDSQHCHCCIKLSLPKGWAAPRQYLHLNYEIYVNIQQFESAEFYSYPQWYVSKTDTNLYHSSGHPPLEKWDHHAQKNASLLWSQKSVEQEHFRVKNPLLQQHHPQENLQKKQRNIGKLTALDAAMFAVTNNIKKERVIFAAANACRLEGTAICQTVWYAIPYLWLT